MNTFEIERNLTWFQNRRVLTMLRPLWQDGTYIMNKEGKLEPARVSTAVNTPWVYTRKARFNCGLRHKILFDYLKMLPSKCLECWKVVIRPRTLKELFILHDWQENVYTKSCKCGIEVRPSVFGHYGGYHYNASIEEGLESYDIVRKAANEIFEDGENVPVLLKRGCTEFEHHFGPSMLWENQIAEGQIELEEKVKNIIDHKEFKSNDQPESIKYHVMSDWIAWAYQNGDATYLEFTDGKPLYPKYDTYHDMPEEVRKRFYSKLSVK